MDDFGAISHPLNYAIGVMLGGGWLLVIWGIRLLFTGKLATPVQIEEKNKELDYLKESNKELKYQNQLLVTEFGQTLTVVLEAIRQVAEEKEAPG